MGWGLAFAAFGLSVLASSERRNVNTANREAEARQAENNAVLAGLNAAIIGRNAQYQYQFAYAQAQALSASADFAIQLGEYNARFALGRSEIEAARQRRFNERLMGTQRAQFAHAGVQIDTGTPLAVQVMSAAEGELDAQLFEFGGEADAFTARVNAEFQAADLRNQAGVTRFQGDIALRFGKTQAAAKLIESRMFEERAGILRDLSGKEGRSILLGGLGNAALTGASLV